MGESEQRLVWLARAGDKEAFSGLVSLFESRIYRAAYALTANEDDAKDLAQETFVRAYKGIGRFRGRSSFFTWLYSILLNRFRSYVRKKSRRAEIADNEEWGRTPMRHVQASASSSDRASNREAVDRVYKAISSLPYEQKMVIVLHCLEDMTYREIASAMRCSIGTVKSRIHAARLSLKRKLFGEFDH